MARAVDTLTLPKETVASAIEYIAEHLREADLDELSATFGYGVNPQDAITVSWESSARAWIILDRTALPIGIFGVAPASNPALGVAWLIGTEGVEREALSVARQTRRYIAEMHEEFPVLWNYIDARNELTIRWLEWAGFQITDAHLNHGPEGRLFFEFSRIAD